MAQSYGRLFYHFVWATWNREPLLTGPIQRHAYALIRSKCRELRCEVHALGGIADHVHLLVSLPRTLCVADFAEGVKGASSRALNKARVEVGEGFKWQGGYGSLTVSPSHLRRVIRYIENQEEHHRAVTLWEAAERIEVD